MEFRVLGPIEVLDRGEPVSLGGRKQRSVLAVLVAAAGNPVSVDTLVDAVWGEAPPQRAKGAIQTYISNLRGVIGDRIDLRDAGYALDLEPESVDLFRFEALVARGRELIDTDPEEARRLLGDALALWRGPPFADLDEHTTLRPTITALEETRLVALEARIEADLAVGRHLEVVGELESLCEEFPLRESFRRLHMLALYRAGRQSEALSAFQKTRAELAELGIEPTTELQDLEQRILEHSASLEQKTPASPTTTVSSVPRPRTRLVGQQAALQQIEELIDRHRLVTITGVGGSGKTRLAVEIGIRLEDRMQDGVFFVDLSPVGDPDQTAGAVGDVLSLPSGHQTASLEDVVVGFLSGREALLLLDNCEHLIDGIADLVDRVLARAPGMRVLATSREALGVEGEAIFTVPSLDPVDDAVVLFADRAEAVQPGFRLESGQRSAVEEICRRLDGIPLAIELAAARVQHLSPPEIVERLDDRFRLLTGRGRRQAQRQQTLQAVLDWSHDLLEEEEQILFRRLSVFAGGFTLPAVEGICSEGMSSPTIDLVGSLVSKSLVDVNVQDVAARYRLLETVRMYAQDKLHLAGEASAVRTEHRDWFLAQVESSPDDPLMAIRPESEVDVDSDNLRLAVEWSAGQGRWDLVVRLLTSSFFTWVARPSRATEVQRWLEAAAASEGLDPALVFRAHAAASWIATLATDYNSMGEHAARALELEPDPITEHAPWGVVALFSSMMWTMMFADAEAADQPIRRALDLIREHALEETECRYRIGLLRVTQQRHADAAKELDAVIEQVGTDAVWAATEAVIVHHLLGEHDQAIELAERLRKPVELPDPTLEVVSRTSLAIADLSRGQLDQARSRLLDALGAARRDRVPLGPERCLVSLAYVEAHHGTKDLAALVLARATDLSEFPFRTPADVALYRSTIDVLRGSLDKDKRRRLRAEGRQLGLDELVALVNSSNA